MRSYGTDFTQLPTAGSMPSLPPLVIQYPDGHGGTITVSTAGASSLPTPKDLPAPPSGAGVSTGVPWGMIAFAAIGVGFVVATIALNGRHR